VKINEDVVNTHVVSVVQRVRDAGNDLQALQQIVKALPGVTAGEKVVIKDRALDQLLAEATQRLANKSCESETARKLTPVDHKMIISNTVHGKRMVVGTIQPRSRKHIAERQSARKEEVCRRDLQIPVNDR